MRPTRKQRENVAIVALKKVDCFRPDNLFFFFKPPFLNIHSGGSFWII